MHACGPSAISSLGSLTIPTDEEGSIKCSVSIGLAQYDNEEEPNELIRRADDKLYESKRLGKNRYTA